MTKNISIVAILALFFFSCESGPKVIESETPESAVNQVLGGGNTPHNHETPASATQQDEHKVIAKETLHTDKYTYVRVSENDQEFWIAIPKSNVEIGTTYYYRGGLMKKDFQSKEYNRVFETLYLVSGLSTQPAQANMGGPSVTDQVMAGKSGGEADLTPPTEINAAKGSIKISELIGNLSKYEGKTVQVTGKCMKVNPMIMGRNWIHIQDGSANNFDLTFTTNEQVEPGSVVTLQGTVAVNKDFGAGYKYNVIVEGATVK